MSMKKQPEGVRRIAKVAGEKPPQSYDLYLGKGKDQVFLGSSERLPKGSWQARPAIDDGTEIPPFKNHTALVEFLLSAYKGLEVHPGTQESTSAEETASVLADPETMAAIAEGQEDLTPAEADQLVAALAEHEATHYEGDGCEPPHAVETPEPTADQLSPLEEWEAEVLATTEAVFEPGTDVGGASFQAEVTPEGEAPPAGSPGPDGVPFSHAEEPSATWEPPKPESVPSFDSLWGSVGEGEDQS
jgi:hypothetical protein